MIKYYRLKKDLPGLKAGKILRAEVDGQSSTHYRLCGEAGFDCLFPIKRLSQMPDWFEPLSEKCNHDWRKVTDLTWYCLKCPAVEKRPLAEPIEEEMPPYPDYDPDTREFKKPMKVELGETKCLWRDKPIEEGCEHEWVDGYWLGWPARFCKRCKEVPRETKTDRQVLSEWLFEKLTGHVAQNFTRTMQLEWHGRRAEPEDFLELAQALLDAGFKVEGIKK